MAKRDPLAAYYKEEKQVRDLLNRLNQGLKQHDEKARKKMIWPYVADLTYVVELLKEAVQFIEAEVE